MFTFKSFLIEQQSELPTELAGLFNRAELEKLLSLVSQPDDVYREYPLTSYEEMNQEYKELRSKISFPLTIYRAIDASYNELVSPLGEYWSWRKEGADTHGATHAVAHAPLILSTTLQNSTPVDWKKTVAANLEYPYEYEITLKKGSVVTVNGKQYTI